MSATLWNLLHLIIVVLNLHSQNLIKLNLANERVLLTKELIEEREEEIKINKTELGRAAVKELQGFASMAQLLPQSVVDNLLTEKKQESLTIEATSC